MVRIVYLFLLLVCISCQQRQPEPVHLKDLGQHMMDLKIYQENLGELLQEKRLSDASWLLEGMDSILHVVSDEFKTHRKLTSAFSYYYDKDLKKPVQGIRSAIEDNDTAAALRHYRILIRNCNGCHVDHDVDKEVRF